MGVQGLWGAIEKMQRSGHLNEFRGRTIAVDAPNVLHQLARPHATALARGEWQGLARQFVKKFETMSRRFKVTFVLVFDGGDPPMKEAERAGREADRERYRSIAVELHRAGEHELADTLLKKAPTVGRYTHLVAQAVRKSKVLSVIMAPMEAEAELAWLSRQPHVAAVWSGDSDVVAYFTHKVLIRNVDGATGKIDAYDLDNLAAWQKCGALGTLQDKTQFILACVVAGSDYTPTLTHKIDSVARCVAQLSRDADFVTQLAHVAERFRLSATERHQCHQAIYAILHHWVYNPTTRGVEHNFQPPAGQPLDLAVLGECERQPDRAYARYELCESNEPVPTPLFDDPTLPRYVVPSRPPKQRPELWCDVCGVPMDSEMNSVAHLKGSNHAALVKLAEIRKTHTGVDADVSSAKPSADGAAAAPAPKRPLLDMSPPPLPATVSVAPTTQPGGRRRKHGGAQADAAAAVALPASVAALAVGGRASHAPTARASAGRAKGTQRAPPAYVDPAIVQAAPMAHHATVQLGHVGQFASHSAHPPTAATAPISLVAAQSAQHQQRQPPQQMLPPTQVAPPLWQPPTGGPPGGATWPTPGAAAGVGEDWRSPPPYAPAPQPPSAAAPVVPSKDGVRGVGDVGAAVAMYSARPKCSKCSRHFKSDAALQAHLATHTT